MLRVSGHVWALIVLVAHVVAVIVDVGTPVAVFEPVAIFFELGALVEAVRNAVAVRVVHARRIAKTHGTKGLTRACHGHAKTGQQADVAIVIEEEPLREMHEYCIERAGPLDGLADGRRELDTGMQRSYAKKITHTHGNTETSLDKRAGCGRYGAYGGR